MSFLDVGGGVTKWSQVTIDSDKDMLGFGLSDLKELALGMSPGDLLAYDAASNRIAIVKSNVLGSQLLTKGTKFPPVWGYPDVGDIGTTIINMVAASANDSEGSGGVYSNTSNQLRFGNNGGSVLNSAMRFTGINIPLGGVIYNAYIGFTCNSARATQTVTTILKGEKSASPAVYGAAEDFTARAYTTASTLWTPQASWSLSVQYQSGSVTNIVQELCNTYGAYVNGTMAIQCLNYGTSATNYQSAYSYDNTPASAPFLVITYGVP